MPIYPDTKTCSAFLCFVKVDKVKKCVYTVFIIKMCAVQKVQFLKASNC